MSFPTLKKKNNPELSRRKLSLSRPLPMFTYTANTNYRSQNAFGPNDEVLLNRCGGNQAESAAQAKC